MTHTRTLSIWLLLAAFAFALTPTQRSVASGSTVVGNGTPASCTNTALNNAILNGGLVSFDCGPNPVTIPITTTVFYDGQVISDDLEIDGGNLVTLQGTAGTRIMQMRTWGFNATLRLTLRNLRFEAAQITGSQKNANGAALHALNQSAAYPNDPPIVSLHNVTFVGNISTQTNNNVNGYDYGGGAIYVQGGDLNVYDSTFTNNESRGGGGGAIHILNGNLHIEDSLFHNNSTTPVTASNTVSGWGGAVYVDGARTGTQGNGRIEIRNSDFTNNFAGKDGGVAFVSLYENRNSSMLIEGSRFIGNSATHADVARAGAVLIQGLGSGGSVDVELRNSLFQDNFARGTARGGTGGAVDIRWLNLEIGNTSFVNNRAEGECANCFNATGGAMFTSGLTSNALIVNSTFVDNYAGWGPGALSNDQALLYNTIFYNNTAFGLGFGSGQQHCRDAQAGGANNLQFPIPAGETPCLPGITNLAAQVGPVVGNAATLLANSPAIDAGSASRCTASPVSGEDGNGTARPIGPVCDIGAWEYAPSIASGDCNADGSINATDRQLLRLELFDGDGSNAVDARGGTANGDPIGCDANGDSTIDSGDMACIMLLLAGDTSCLP